VKSGRADAPPLFAPGAAGRANRGGQHGHAAHLKERAALGPNLFCQK